MPNELLALGSEEVSAVTRAANRRRFLLRKGLTMDDIKAIQLLNDLDDADMGDVVAALAKGDDADVAAALEKAEGLSAADKKKVRAAARIMGPAMAKKYLKAFPPSGQDDGEEDGEDEEDETPKLKRRKGESDAAYTKRCKARKAVIAKAIADLDVGDRADQEDEPVAVTFQKNDETGEYDLRGVPKESRALVQAILLKSDADREADRERLTKAEADLAAVVDLREREKFIRKAATLRHIPGAKADDLATILRKVTKALTPAEAAKFDAILTSTEMLLAKSAAFEEVGSEASGGDATDSPEVELTTRATELQKSDPNLTREGARSRILKSDPSLQSRLNDAQDARISVRKRGG